MKKGVMKEMTAVLGAILLFTGVSASEVRAEDDNSLKVSGFVDVSYSDSDESGSYGTFSLDQVEVDFEKQIDDKLSVRADFQFGTDGCASCGDGTSNTDSTFGIEQGYVTYSIPDAVEITAGLFNAPIGFESLDPTDMYQFSHGLVFANGIPTNIAGLKASAAPVEMLDISFYVVNGWDLATDNNNAKTIGGRVGITPTEGVNVGLSAITGPETAANTKDKRTVIDVDLTVTAVNNLTIGAEYNSGEEDKASAVTAGKDAEWSAFSVMANYGITDDLGLTLRYESFDDEEGSRLGTVGGLAQKQESITIAAGYSLGEGAGVVVEYRKDESDQKAFSGGAEDSKATYALEFTYSF